MGINLEYLKMLEEHYDQRKGEQQLKRQFLQEI